MEFSFDQIDAILNARSIAIVGASGKPGKFGHALVAAQLAMEFQGPMYLVNPGETEILGRRAYPSLESLPEVPDLVYLTIPAHLSLDVLKDCGRLGVRGVVIIAAGFREAGAEGEALEREALDLARRGGFRIIGPNCFGIYNPRNRLTLLPGYDLSPVPGDTAFLSQSGGFSLHLARMGKSLGIPFRAVVSYGNGTDLDECDFLRYFARDPGTRYIAAYLEGTRKGSEFLKALREACAQKPVMVWKVGKGEASRRAVSSHTGSLAGSAEVWRSVLAQAGAMNVSGIDEILDVLLALRHLGRGWGRRVLIAGGGGGLGTYGADLAEAAGLSVPPLEARTHAKLREILVRAGAVVGNPLDLGTPMIPLALFAAAMREAAANPSTDLLVFDLAVNFVRDLVGDQGSLEAADALARAKQETGKPVAAILYSRACDPEDTSIEKLLRQIRARLLDRGVAVFPSMARAARALSLVGAS